MAHLQSTPGFTIRGLRFLVVDEADRLLRQDYQGWLPEVLAQIQTHDDCSALQPPATHTAAPTPQQQQLQLQGPKGLPPDPCATPFLPFSRYSSRLMKLIVSATLTRDPSKLLRLELHNPRYITLTELSHRYALPKALVQHMLVVPAQHKPLALLGLLHQLAGTTSIIFASSLETTHRCELRAGG